MSYRSCYGITVKQPPPAHGLNAFSPEHAAILIATETLKFSLVGESLRGLIIFLSDLRSLFSGPLRCKESLPHAPSAMNLAMPFWP